MVVLALDQQQVAAFGVHGHAAVGMLDEAVGLVPGRRGRLHRDGRVVGAEFVQVHAAQPGFFVGGTIEVHGFNRGVGAQDDAAVAEAGQGTRFALAECLIGGDALPGALGVAAAEKLPAGVAHGRDVRCGLRDRGEDRVVVADDGWRAATPHGARAVVGRFERVDAVFGSTA